MLRKTYVFITDSTGNNKIETTFHNKKLRHLIYRMFFSSEEYELKNVGLAANKAAVLMILQNLRKVGVFQIKVPSE